MATPRPTEEREIDELLRQVDRLREQFAESKKTPWGTIGSIGGIIVMVVFAFFALIGSRFDAVNTRIESHEKGDSELKTVMEKTATESVRRSELLATKESLNTEIQATSRHIDEINQSLSTINNELIRRRAEFVEQVELRALEKRIDEMLRALASRIDMRLTISAFDAWKAERDRRFDQLEQKK